MLFQRSKPVWNLCRFYSTSNEAFQNWISSTKQTCQNTKDIISPSRFNLFSNTLPTTTSLGEAFPKKGTLLPPGWHHIYFPPRSSELELASDGYESEFFPPAPFSQRMWAGAKYTFNVDNPLKVGDHVTMKTYMDNASIQHGRLGEQATVWINKEIHNETNGWSMTEQRCMVYHPKQSDHQVEQRGIKVRKQPDLSIEMMPSSILLFRYSALTFNSHKIHFDHEYATKQEHHPACLVHGPLSGNLLLDMVYNNNNEKKTIQSFEYKCLIPLYVNQKMTLSAKYTDNGMDVWITNHQHHLAVKGSVSFLRNT